MKILILSISGQIQGTYIVNDDIDVEKATKLAQKYGFSLKVQQSHYMATSEDLLNEIQVHIDDAVEATKQADEEMRRGNG